MGNPKHYTFRLQYEKEFPTGGSVTVSVTYDIRHYEELKKLPAWVKDLAARDKLDIFTRQKVK